MNEHSIILLNDFINIILLMNEHSIILKYDQTLKYIK